MVTDGADTVVTIPHAAGGSIIRVLTGVFLLAWLGGWAVGWIMVGSLLVSGFPPVPPGGGPPRGLLTGVYIFVACWFVAWTVGGIFAMSILYRMLRPSVPEMLRLRAHDVMYDSGVSPPQDFSGRTAWRRGAWRSVSARRTRVALDRRALQTLRLRETDAGNRLTVDAGAERLEIAKSASEVEREWLYQMLVKRYAPALPQA